MGLLLAGYFGLTILYLAALSLTSYQNTWHVIYTIFASYLPFYILVKYQAVSQLGMKHLLLNLAAGKESLSVLLDFSAGSDVKVIKLPATFAPDELVSKCISSKCSIW